MKIALFQSSLGKKYVMAATGFVLFVFVLLHLLGNLQIFLGPNRINRYGSFLQNSAELIWPARIGLLVVVGLHIWAAVRLSIENRAARPEPYGFQKIIAATLASRTMLLSGVTIAVFVIYHILHFTVQVQAVNLTGKDFRTLEDPLRRHDIYSMMVTGFSNLWVSLFYLVGMALLCLHLSHGASSMFQSMGWKNKKYGGFLDRAARVVALLVFLGYASIPISILTGVLKIR